MGRRIGIKRRGWEEGWEDEGGEKGAECMKSRKEEER